MNFSVLKLCINVDENQQLMSPSLQVLLLLKKLQLQLNLYNNHTIGIFSFHLKEVFHAQYILELGDTHENVFLEWHCNCDHLILGLKYRYLVIVHNNSKNKSNAILHILMMDMHIFFHSHFKCCFYYMLNMWHDQFFVCLK